MKFMWITLPPIIYLWKKGDYVKIVSTCGEHALVKKNGIMGWIPRKILSK